MMFLKGMLAMFITVYLPGVGHLYLGRFKKGFFIIGALVAQVFLISARVVRDKELFAKVQAFIVGGRFKLEDSEAIKNLVQTHMGQTEIFIWQLIYAAILAYAFTDIILMMKNYHAQNKNEK